MAVASRTTAGAVVAIILLFYNIYCLLQYYSKLSRCHGPRVTAGGCRRDSVAAIETCGLQQPSFPTYQLPAPPLVTPPCASFLS